MIKYNSLGDIGCLNMNDECWDILVYVSAVVQFAIFMSQNYAWIVQASEVFEVFYQTMS